jgi:molecular chaperone GrpE (heat shock protein)
VTQAHERLETASGVELHAWAESEQRAPLQAIEEDIIRLLRQLSEARLAVEQGERAGNQAQKRLLIGVADALDGMQRVLGQVELRKSEGMVLEPAVKAWLGNFRTASKLLTRLLTEHQVTEFRAGSTFDPHEHRVLESRRDDRVADGTVLETTLPGYRWKGEVLRRAEVIVARSTPVDADGEELESTPS